MTTTLKQLLALADKTLQPKKVKDYCPNGLQVEGKAEIKKLVVGVTASQALLDEAIKVSADALLVHHGYFWRGEDPRVVGIKRQRLASLLKNDMSLLAYHLPLDTHATLGNNAQFSQVLGLDVLGLLPIEPAVVAHGVLGRNLIKAGKSMQASLFAEHIGQCLGRKTLFVSGGDHSISTVAWCTGAGQGYIEQVAEKGCDAFISGEISEQTMHLARELGVHYFAAGHHATERYGVQALGQYLAGELGIECQFVDVDNPA